MHGLWEDYKCDEVVNVVAPQEYAPVRVCSWRFLSASTSRRVEHIQMGSLICDLSIFRFLTLV